jgi:hypothetical protein
MIKRIIVFVSAVAVGGFAAAVAGPALGDHGSGSEQPRTLTVYEKETESSYVDLGEEGFGIGDEGAVWTANLKKNGDVVGHDSGVCFVTSSKIPAGQCSITADFGDGEMTFQGVNDLTSRTNDAVITGGTGTYDGAEGIVLLRFLPERGVHRLKFVFSD